MEEFYFLLCIMVYGMNHYARLPICLEMYFKWVQKVFFSTFQSILDYLQEIFGCSLIIGNFKCVSNPCSTQVKPKSLITSHGSSIPHLQISFLFSFHLCVPLSSLPLCSSSAIFFFSDFLSCCLLLFLQLPPPIFANSPHNVPIVSISPTPDSRDAGFYKLACTQTLSHIGFHSKTLSLSLQTTHTRTHLHIHSNSCCVPTELGTRIGLRACVES